MSTDTHDSDVSGREQARELIRERDRIQDWLTRLDEQAAEKPAHIVGRIREDYQNRRAKVTGELGEHRDALAADLSSARERLTSAEALHAKATDALEETALRHDIGELGDETWDARKPELEGELEAAVEDRDAAAGEVEALAGLLKEIGDAAPPEPPREATRSETPEEDDGIFADWEFEADEAKAAEAPPEEPEPEEAAVAADDGAEEPRAKEPVAREVDPTEGEPSDDDAADTGLEFLDELDRVLASAPAIERKDEESGTTSTMTRTLVCKDCGAANDSRAWYCEVCGEELSAA